MDRRSWLGGGVLLGFTAVMWIALADSRPPSGLKPRPASRGVSAPAAAAAGTVAATAARQRQGEVLIATGDRDTTLRQFPWLTPPQLADGRRFVRVDISAINALHVGDTFTVHVSLGGEPQTALVDGEQWYEDVRRLTGSWWDGEGREHRFGVSLASDGSYVAGSFNDATGQQLLEARQGAGWVQDSAAASVALGGDR